MGFTVNSTTAEGDFEIIGGVAPVTIRYKTETQARIDNKHITLESYLEPSVMLNNMVKDNAIIGLHPFWAIFSRTTPEKLQTAITRERKDLEPVDHLKVVCAIEEAQECGMIEISNIVLLGSGSMHVGGCNVCCQHRPEEAIRQVAEAIELAEYFGSCSEPLPLVAQDPAYSKLERKFMESKGITVLDDPDAFEVINEETLLIAHGVWWSVWHTVSKGPRPAAILSMDVPSKIRNEKKSKKAGKSALETQGEREVLEMFGEYERVSFHDEELEELVRAEHKRMGREARRELRERKMDAPCLFVKIEV